MLAEKQEKVFDESIEYKPKTIKVKKVKKINTNKKTSKVRIIFIAIISLGVSLALISEYTKITTIKSEIANLENEREELEKKKINLEARLEEVKSSEKIVEDAQIKLGMDYPTESQIAYIYVPNEKNKENESLFSGVKKQISKTLNHMKSFLGGIIFE